MIEFNLTSAIILCTICVLSWLYMMYKTTEKDPTFLQVVIMLILGAGFLVGLSEILKITIV